MSATTEPGKGLLQIAGIDVGGTFTDLYYLRSGEVGRVVKVPSVPVDPSAGLMAALTKADVALPALNLIVHGTTIATNAVIERTGACAALLTTQGFRDILELGRRDRPQMYGLSGTQDPLIPRLRRLEVTERLDATGQVVTPLDVDALQQTIEALREMNVESVVVSLLHAYANPAHEIAIGEVLRASNPDWEVVLSHAVCNEYFEFERTSTAAVQGYLQPLVSRYATRLRLRLDEAAFSGTTLIMQSSGGVVPLDAVSGRAANIVRSGPAAGVMAAANLAAQAGFERVITGDMGGTSFDVAVVIDGQPRVTRSTKLDFRIPLQLPMIDVHTIGAGGGSIASLDRAGILQVGPESAGADPGPVCFGRGGVQPTVTDANVVLGRINWRHPIGFEAGATLDVEAARAAIAELGQQLDLDVEDTAGAIITLVNQSMAGRTRLLSVEQGLDPRDFVFVSFGGAGPLHGAAIMREVGIHSMLIPPDPGVLCALGCCIADLRHDYSRTVEQGPDSLGDDEMKAILDEQISAGMTELQTSGDVFDLVDVTIRHTARMCYQGQIHTLRVPIATEANVADLPTAFAQVYEAEFGNTLGDLGCVIVSLETTVSAPPPLAVTTRPPPTTSSGATPRGQRDVFFSGWQDVDVFDRGDLHPGMSFDGPAIVEQPDCTVVIEPNMNVHVDAFANLIVEAP